MGTFLMKRRAGWWVRVTLLFMQQVLFSLFNTFLTAFRKHKLTAPLP
jgi:hypothetical protein